MTTDHQRRKHNIYLKTPLPLSPVSTGFLGQARNGASAADVARFWAKVRRGGAGECWLWTASVTGRATHQYGQFVLGDGKVYAHRFAYELEHGPIPVGMVVCHACDVTRCCNSAHLFLGTQTDNIRDASAKGHLRVARKRNRQIKPTVVGRYLSNADATAKVLGVEFGISHITVHRWIREATNGADQRSSNGRNLRKAS